MTDLSGNSHIDKSEKDSAMPGKINDEPVAWWQPAVVLFVRLSAWIAGPVIIGTFLGKFLDQKLNTEPIMLISVVGFSFLISMAGLVRESAKEFKKIEDQEKRKKEKRKDNLHNT